MSNGEPIAHVDFVGRAMRPMFAERDCQYVMDDAGGRVWYIPRNAADEPISIGLGDTEIAF
jgi:hypothetical protein